MKTKETVLSPITYRPDIDGLRAIAVLAVVFFHAFPQQLKGGFIGVDIFFVISGFLITSILITDLNNKHFTFRDFYSRRVRRLGPALIIVLLVSFISGLFLFQANEFNQLKKHILGGITFTSNLIFLREAGYFDYASDSKTLLHLWSLGIEEQFYLIWPVLIFIFFKYKKLNLILFISFIIILSFVSNIVLSDSDPVAAFFSLQARFWELAVGAALAISRLQQPLTVHTCATYVEHTKGILGSILIGLGLVFISNQTAFPGWWSLLPVLGAALIISAGPHSLINRHLLSNNKLVYVGLLSYPLYLWHWPLLSVARTLFSGTPPYAARLGLLLLAFTLAALTYHLVERPIRNHKASRHATPVIIVALLVILIAAIWPQSTIPLVQTTSGQMASREAFESHYLPVDGLQTLKRFEGKFRHECNFYQVERFYEGKATNIPKQSIDESCYTPDGVSQHSVLIWGDSHAQMLNVGLSQHLPKAWQVFQVASSGCHPTVVSFQDSDTNYCVRSNWFALKTVRDNKIKVVVVAQSVDHDPVQMGKIATKLEALGVERIIFLGSTPRWTDYLPKIILRHLWPNPPERTFTGVDRDLIRRDILVKRNFKRSDNRVFVDVIDLFCNQQGCLTQLIGENGPELTSWDFGHLTQAASNYLAEKILVDAVTGRLN
jgi:peptidoglycan/LPS O-acetylase OafA/YrhL